MLWRLCKYRLDVIRYQILGEVVLTKRIVLL